jgi:hypothetical protein
LLGVDLFAVDTDDSEFATICLGERFGRCLQSDRDASIGRLVGLWAQSAGCEVVIDLGLQPLKLREGAPGRGSAGCSS